MGRTKGSQNKVSNLPYYASLPINERIALLANLIVDRIESDQQSGRRILKKIKEQADAY